MTLPERYWDITHGWHGLVTLYLVVAAFSLAGLKRGQATVGQYFLWPVTTLPTLVVTGLAAQCLLWLLETLADVHWGWIAQSGFAAIVCMVGGVLGGAYWSTRGKTVALPQGRGAIVVDGAWAQKASQKRRDAELKAGKGDFHVRLAGVTVPGPDELKHFKLMGTTGSGKSTALRELLHGALYRGDRAVIADPDGGYLSTFYNCVFHAIVNSVSTGW